MLKSSRGFQCRVHKTQKLCFKFSSYLTFESIFQPRKQLILAFLSWNFWQVTYSALGPFCLLFVSAWKNLGANFWVVMNSWLESPFDVTSWIIHAGCSTQGRNWKRKKFWVNNFVFPVGLMTRMMAKLKRMKWKNS